MVEIDEPLVLIRLARRAVLQRGAYHSPVPKALAFRTAIPLLC
jgi:hypothetical protein